MSVDGGDPDLLEDETVLSGGAGSWASRKYVNDVVVPLVGAEWYSVDALDRKESFLHTVTEFTEGKLNWSIFKQVEGSGELTFAKHEPLPGFGVNDRLQVNYHKGDQKIPLGIYIPSVDQFANYPGRSTSTVKLSDKLELLNTPTGQYITLSNVMVLTWISNLLNSRWDENKVALTPYDPAQVEDNPSWLIRSELVKGPKTWKPDNTWLTIVNDLLNIIGYGSLWVDRYGYFRADPYVSPGNRLPIATYGGAGADYRMVSNWTDESTQYNVPNVWVVYKEGDSSTKGFYAVARNEDPGDPYSVPSRGREIVRITQSDSITSDAEAKRVAERLLGYEQITRKASFRHPVDSTWVNDTVKIEPAGFWGAITIRDMDLKPGAVVTDTIRHFYKRGALPWAT